MTRIAIVDDEKYIRNHLRALIEKQNIECEIQEYSSTSEYIKRQQETDLLFLDIGMSNDEIDGMALARAIRNGTDKQPVIIFVTGIEAFVYEAFDVNAFHYLLKPVDAEKFAQVLTKAFDSITQAKLKKKSQSIQIQYAGKNKTILIDTIYFIESFNHKISVHTSEGNMECYARIGDLELELTGKFYRIHKGYLINLSHVDSYSKTEVVLTNGNRLMISKYKYVEFVKAYLKFIEKED